MSVDIFHGQFYYHLIFFFLKPQSLVAFVRKSWNYAGRPTLCLVIREEHFHVSKKQNPLNGKCTTYSDIFINPAKLMFS